MPDMLQRIIIAFLYVGGAFIALFGASPGREIFMLIGFVVLIAGVFWRTRLYDWKN